MRDITICKGCKNFIENHLDGKRIRNLHDSRTMFDAKWIEKNCIHFRRRHVCGWDDFTVKHGEDMVFTEYYRMPVPSECPYRMEQQVSCWNHEFKNVDYGILRHFRRRRICQHCGEEIPNKRKCPNCGYESFDVYKPYNEHAIFAQIVLLIYVALGLFCSVKYSNDIVAFAEVFVAAVIVTLFAYALFFGE